MVSINSKQTVHAAASSVAAAQGENPAVSEDYQVNFPLVWDEVTLSAVRSKKVCRRIAEELAKVGRLADLEDVLQETWIVANDSLSRYDPQRFGLSVQAVQAWFVGVAANVARSHVRSVVRTGHRLPLVPVEEAEYIAVDQPVDVDVLAPTVLRLLADAVPNKDALYRALVAAVVFDGSGRATARYLGVSESLVAVSRQQVRRVGQVVARALLLRQSRVDREVFAPVTVGELVACLPDDSCTRAWVEILGRVGSVQAVTAECLGGVLGVSRPVAQRYGAELLRLLGVARSVVEIGTLGAGTAGA